jgi:hypothetical protein
MCGRSLPEMARIQVLFWRHFINQADLLLQRELKI